MSDTAWGAKETQFFFQLTPDVILQAVEDSTGLRCSGRLMALNSMENRVYEIEIETDEPVAAAHERFRIIKFYRPGRWSLAQILEEHEFLFDLIASEVPAVAPLKLHDGKSLHKLPEIDIYYAIFPKCQGRSPDELLNEETQRVGRLLARLHNVGASKAAKTRIKIDVETYGIKNLQTLRDLKVIPPTMEENFQTTVESICRTSEPLFAKVPTQRIHGDCHLGNLLFGKEGFFWVDFDDMVVGPCVQDLWLLIGGRDQRAQEQLNELINAYEMMRPFDRQTLRLIEPLRALRMIHFSAWIAKRWHDPAFPRSFPNYGTTRYWQELYQDLQEQLQYIQETF